MEKIKGDRIESGIAIGRIRFYDHNVNGKEESGKDIDRNIIDTEAELARFENARLEAIRYEKQLYKKALSESGEDSAAVFLVHRMILEDHSLIDLIHELITAGRHSAEYAVREACIRQARLIADTDDAYISERDADVIDSGKSILLALTGGENDISLPHEPTIFVGEDFFPSDIIKTDRRFFCGFVSSEGSSTSHTAILAKSMNLHAIVNTGRIDRAWDGKVGIIDCDNSCFIIDPTVEMLEAARKRRESDASSDGPAFAMIGQSSTTIDGKNVRLLANINDPSEMSEVLNNDAEGIGLMRSEFLFMNSKDHPDEEEQFTAYRGVLQAMAPKRVIIRTSDIGEDKIPLYMNKEQEINPALGFRGIRISLLRRDIFKVQLRAILRASWYGNAGVMFPMLTSAWELSECIDILSECRRELEKEGIQVKDIPVGAMIETPAAVFEADALAEMCDFLSIGTNDLIQYTCAIDRQNARLQMFYDSHHPAVMKEIQMTIEAAHRHNCRACICGELASDLSLCETFLKMGVDELSVSPAFILPLRQKVRGLDLIE